MNVDSMVRDRNPRRLGYGYAKEVGEFLGQRYGDVLRELAGNVSLSGISADDSYQQRAWEESVDWLNNALTVCRNRLPRSESWGLCLEFEIPRRGYRIDAVLLADGVVIPIEFKTTRADASATRKAEDYGHELADFHEGSQNSTITPILCSAGAKYFVTGHDSISNRGVIDVSTAEPKRLGEAILALSKSYSNGGEIDLEKWLSSTYRPAPTIIEAAKSLYDGHSVEELARTEASATSLRQTRNAIVAMADNAKSNGTKAICFITGIPGAGKTLVGLDAVHNFTEGQATFLSGNGPLVKVLTAALAENLMANKKIKKEHANRRASTFITNVHRWLDEYIDKNPNQIPQENVVVFDEAQRAWNREQSFTKFRRDASEANMILSVMNRRTDWALIIALVGGGQEINTGEAGLAEWGRSLADGFSNWSIGISPALLEGDSSTAGSQLFASIPEDMSSRIVINRALQLPTSQRSFRTQYLTEWVEAVLAGNSAGASKLFDSIGDFPIFLTRNLDTVKIWLEDQTKGLRRSGLIASSGARRLRVHGINVREKIDEVHWFLKPGSDVRSSNFLEVTATEFAVQGLELDWIGLCWGADFRRVGDIWEYRSFKGTKWQSIRSNQDKVYVLNRYRVLLTRAREGIVIWVPEGESKDSTRMPEFYDGTFDYLKNCGIPVIR